MTGHMTTPGGCAKHRTALEELRFAFGYSRDELSHLSGVSPSTIRRIERGTVKANRSTLLALGAALACPPDDLIPPQNGGHRA